MLALRLAGSKAVLIYLLLACFSLARIPYALYTVTCNTVWSMVCVYT